MGDTGARRYIDEKWWTLAYTGGHRWTQAVLTPVPTVQWASRFRGPRAKIDNVFFIRQNSRHNHSSLQGTRPTKRVIPQNAGPRATLLGPRAFGVRDLSWEIHKTESKHGN